MSSSGDVKEELLSVNGNGRHCQIAELAAYFSYCGFVKKGLLQTRVYQGNLSGNRLHE